MTDSRPRNSFADILILALATGLGVGLIPWAPGTFGSLWGLVLVERMQALSLGPVGWGLVSVVIGLAGVGICGAAARGFNRKDPGAVVFDEIAAFPVVFAIVPLTLTSGVLGFLLFRLFDILKPWPCRKLEQLPGGWGVMADDLMAGVYAGAVLWACMAWLVPAASTLNV